MLMQNLPTNKSKATYSRYVMKYFAKLYIGALNDDVLNPLIPLTLAVSQTSQYRSIIKLSTN
jgi:hypothetical protein